MARFGIWKDRTHNLARMTLPDLVKAFVLYPAVHAYTVLALVSLAAVVHWYAGLLPLAIATILTIIVYPLVWYVLHRWVLHGQLLYKFKVTAPVWKRIHFDHHQDPHNLVVLFGALYTTLPTIAIVTLPIGYVVGGPASSAMAFAAGLITTIFYEFCHCVQHLNTQPKTAFMKEIKRFHLAHHFHNEKGNFGITNYLWDRLFGTFYPKSKLWPKSPTVFNLGYTEEVASVYPWVAELSNGTRGDGNPRRFRMADATDARQ